MMLKFNYILAFICLFGNFAISQSTLDDYDKYRMSSSIGVSIGSANYSGELTENESYSGISNLAPLSAGVTAYVPISESIVAMLGMNYSRLSHTALIGATPSNFQAKLAGATLGAYYRFDNGNIFKTTEKFNVMIGLGGSFHSNVLKTDRKDANGNVYNYWSDGTIRDVPENSMMPLNTILIRDYIYESDIIVESNAVIGGWVELNLGYRITPRITGRVGYRQTFTLSDMLDGIETSKSKDRFNNFFVGLEFGLGTNPHKADDKQAKIISKTIDLEDEDGDGIDDIHDYCALTPKGSKVDKHGCELDSDHDGISDSKDVEKNSESGALVNPEGKTYSEEEITVITLLQSGNMRTSEMEAEYFKKYPEIFKRYQYLPNEVEKIIVGKE
jgi:hypothetical protein